jgi:hypothetical protein
LKVGAPVDTDIKALAVRVIDVPCTWSTVGRSSIIAEDGGAVVIDRMHVAIGDRDVGAIRRWITEKQFHHRLFVRVLVDPANGTRTKVDTIILFHREEDAMLFKLTF